MRETGLTLNKGIKMKSMLSILFCLTILTLTACGPTWVQHDNNTLLVPGPTVSVPEAAGPVTEDQDIAAVLADENTYRLSLGQTELSSGLSCSVQLVTTGQWLSSSSPGYNALQGIVTTSGPSYSFLLNQPIDQPNSGPGDNSVLPLAVQPLFTSNNYKLSCSGQLVILTTGYYGFDLSSDDGSILTIDGTQVVNNDGNHSVQTVSGTKLLRRDVHTINLVYAQTGSGNFALVLNMNSVLLDNKLFAH